MLNIFLTKHNVGGCSGFVIPNSYMNKDAPDEMMFPIIMDKHSL